MENKAIETYKSSPNAADIKVTDYLDYRAFMREYYEQQKQKNSKFSFALWSDLAGFKSRSFLRLVMLGKRSLTSESQPLAAKALGLNKQDTNYFINLVNYNQANNHKSREYFLTQLMKSNISKKVTPIKDSYRYLSNQLVPRLQILLAMRGFPKNTEQLAKFLNTTEAQIKQALEVLETLGLARFDELANEWTTSTQNFSIQDDLGNLALQSFHKKSLEESIAAINQPKEIRHYSSLLLTLNPQEYQEVIKEIDHFFDHLLLKYNDTDFKGRRLYQINNNLIPVSEPHIREKKDN